jgi:hypothetical protein
MIYSGTRLQILQKVSDPTGSGYDFGSGSTTLGTAEIFLYLFWPKIAIYFTQGLHKGSKAREERPSALKREHLKKSNVFIFFNFCGSFLTSWFPIHITGRQFPKFRKG